MESEEILQNAESRIEARIAEAGSPGLPPLLMSGESACPIIEAMLRAQIAETRDWRGGERNYRQLEMQPAKNFSSGQVLETCKQVQAFLAFHRRYFYLYTLSCLLTKLFLKSLLIA